MDNAVTVTAIVDFVFNKDPDLTSTELLDDIIDRIKRGEYYPSELVHLQVIQSA